VLKKYSDILKKVYYLADKRHNEYIAESKEKYNGKSFVDLCEVTDFNDTSGLMELLLSQDMDTIKVIQTVMYIGRDYMPETEDEYYERIENNHNDPENTTPEPILQCDEPEKLLQSWLSGSNGVSEWKDKYTEAEQINQKMPLDRYLQRAFIILGMD